MFYIFASLKVEIKDDFIHVKNFNVYKYNHINYFDSLIHPVQFSRWQNFFLSCSLLYLQHPRECLEQKGQFFFQGDEWTNVNSVYTVQQAERFYGYKSRRKNKRA